MLITGFKYLVRGHENNRFVSSVNILVLVCVFVCSHGIYTRWFKYDRDDLCVNKSQFVPVIFEPPCIYIYIHVDIYYHHHHLLALQPYVSLVLLCYSPPLVSILSSPSPSFNPHLS
jgi:hypothetical protein